MVAPTRPNKPLQRRLAPHGTFTNINDAIAPNRGEVSGDAYDNGWNNFDWRPPTLLTASRTTLASLSMANVSTDEEDTQGGKNDFGTKKRTLIEIIDKVVNIIYEEEHGNNNAGHNA